MPKRTTPQLDPDAFARMSRELECDESEEQLERVFARVVKPSRQLDPRAETKPGHKTQRAKPSKG